MVLLIGVAVYVTFVACIVAWDRLGRPSPPGWPSHPIPHWWARMDGPPSNVRRLDRGRSEH